MKRLVRELAEPEFSGEIRVGDCIAELEKLPPTDNSKVGGDEEESPAAAERRRLGGPVPKLLYLDALTAESDNLKLQDGAYRVGLLKRIE